MTFAKFREDSLPSVAESCGLTRFGPRTMPLLYEPVGGGTAVPTCTTKSLRTLDQSEEDIAVRLRADIRELVEVLGAELVPKSGIPVSWLFGGPSWGPWNLDLSLQISAC